MSSSLLKAIPPEYQPIARHYVRLFTDLGWPQDKIDAALQWGASFTGPADQIETQFQEFTATRLGLPPEEAALATNVASELRETINTKGLSALPELKSTAGDEVQGLLNDIRKYRREWPDAYEADKEMQAAELRLLSAVEGDDPRLLAIAPDTSKSAAPDPQVRLAEIRQMRRDDPSGYDFNKVLQAEELSLINMTLSKSPTPEPAAQSAASATAPAAAGSTEGTSNV